MDKGITGIILSGGKSSRMGYEKGLISFNGKKLIEIAVGLFESLNLNILISANNQKYDFLDYPVINDLKSNSGPMGGIYSCMKKAESEWYFIQACDTPFLNVELYQYLFTKRKEFQIIVPDKGKAYYEPLCAIYHASVIPIFEKYIKKGNYRIPDVFENVQFLPVPVNDSLPFYSPCLFNNINSPEEYTRYEKFDVKCRER